MGQGSLRQTGGYAHMRIEIKLNNEQQKGGERIWQNR